MMSRDQIEQVSDDKPRRALVLSGGGSKGAFEAGVLQRLMGEEQRDYDLLCGTSVGAINAAYLAQTPLGQPREAAAKLRALWDTVTTEKIHRRWFPFGNVAALWKTSVYDSEPLHSWIRLFQPSAPLPFDPLDFDPGNLRKMIDAGYAQSAIFAAV